MALIFTGFQFNKVKTSFSPSEDPLTMVFESLMIITVLRWLDAEQWVRSWATGMEISVTLWPCLPWSPVDDAPLSQEPYQNSSIHCSKGDTTVQSWPSRYNTPAADNIYNLEQTQLWFQRAYWINMSYRFVKAERVQWFQKYRKWYF